MQVKDLMSFHPHVCTPQTSLRDAAQLMCDCDCGALPVVEYGSRDHAIGIVTDRDIACRAVAKGMDARTTTVEEVMSKHLATIDEDASIEECYNAMEHARIRRMVVLNRKGELCGIVSQADIALRMAEEQAAELVREVSKPTEEPSLVG
jgi:CBS domain-containing protein